jgi:hypothetical protein
MLCSRLFEGSIMPQSQRLSSVIPFVRSAAPMMLASIEPARAGVDLHTFECAIAIAYLRPLPRTKTP